MLVVCAQRIDKFRETIEVGSVVREILEAIHVIDVTPHCVNWCSHELINTLERSKIRPVVTALMEPKRPTRDKLRLSNDIKVLSGGLSGSRAHEKVEIEHAANNVIPDTARLQANVHTIRVTEVHSMGLAGPNGPDSGVRRTTEAVDGVADAIDIGVDGGIGLQR